MRISETIKIKATEEARRLARLALDVQDACNPVPLCSLLLETQKHFRVGHIHGQEFGGTDIGLQNPVSLSLLNKLNDLAGLGQSRTECFTACQELADGNDVHWSVNVLG